MFHGICSLLLLGTISCSKNSTPDPSLQDPQNLSLEINVSADGSGDIEIIAKADYTIEYQFYLGEPSNNDPSTNTSGLLKYTYATTGNYLIEVRAYGASGKYIRKSEQVFVQVGASGGPTLQDGYSTPLSYPGMTLVWQDEFEGTNLNPLNWSYEIGNGCPNLCGWGNNELEYYRAENSWVEDGALTIEARQESYQGFGYTSTRIKTQNKYSFKYGRVDIRALLPKGQGIWPALWMLGDNITSVGWPACGETDIMELVGHTPNTVHGTLHWDNLGTHESSTGQTALSFGTFADEYHVFTIIWDAQSIKWYVNDQLYQTKDISLAGMTEFHQESFLLFNVAVGGNWPGNPDFSTVFPQQMKVDYIRVFK